MTNLHIFGTRALLRAAEIAGVSRFVHCSSSVTVGFSNTHPVDEEPSENWSMNPSDIYGKKGALRHYYNTKVQSEDLVLGWGNLDTVVVNPDYILGAWDVKPTSGQMILSLCKGRLPVYPLGGKCFLGARDCALAHVAAMERGTSGERYLLGYHNLTYRDMLTISAQIAGVSPPKIPMPRTGTRVLGSIGQVLIGIDAHRFAGLDPYVLRSTEENRFRSGIKMVQELGVNPEPIDQAIEETIRWFKDNGYY